MRSHLNLANLLTTGSLAAGFMAILLAGDGRLQAALAAVAIGVALDAVDGYVARRAAVSGAFGCQLDSLADIVAFGVAPAVMLRQAEDGAMPVLVTAACLAFVVAGGWRLARFAVTNDHWRFVGLPIPPAGMVLAAAAALGLPGEALLALCLVLAVFMVSSIPVPTLAGLGGIVRRPGRGALRVVGGDGAPDGARAGQRASRHRDDDERDDEAYDDERFGTPALARK